MGSAGQVLRTVMMMAGQFAQIRAGVAQRRAQEQERQEREEQAALREEERQIEAEKAADLAARKEVKQIKDRALRERDQRIRDHTINERTETRRQHEAQRRIAEHHLQRADRDQDFFETATPEEIALRYRQAVEFNDESGIAQTMRSKIEEFAKSKGVDLTDSPDEEKADLAAILAKAMNPNRDQERDDDPDGKQRIAEALVAGADADDRAAAAERSASTKLEPQELSEIAQAKREEIQAVLNNLAAKRGNPSSPTAATKKSAPAATRPDRASAILNAAKVRADERASVAPYDSADRRAATAQHLEENTTASADAIQARMSADISSAQPVQTALGAKVRQPTANKSGQVRDLSQKVSARERQEPGR
ncbi:hypothetical protein AXK56_16435 [Tsukamurella pulmonis]|nr:hypothetical protein AXK56_16435 [Tsukamurella pulmonis]